MTGRSRPDLAQAPRQLESRSSSACDWSVITSRSASAASRTGSSAAFALGDQSPQPPGSSSSRMNSPTVSSSSTTSTRPRMRARPLALPRGSPRRRPARRAPRAAHAKARAQARARSRPDVPAVLVDDAVDHREPHAAALADSLVVKNGSNIRSSTSGVMPRPVSRTDELDEAAVDGRGTTRTPPALPHLAQRRCAIAPPPASHRAR